MRPRRPGPRREPPARPAEPACRPGGRPLTPRRGLGRRRDYLPAGLPGRYALPAARDLTHRRLPLPPADRIRCHPGLKPLTCDHQHNTDWPPAAVSNDALGENMADAGTARLRAA